MITRLSSQAEFITDFTANFPRPLNQPIWEISAGTTPLDIHIAKGRQGALHIGAFFGNELVAVARIWSASCPVPYLNIGRTVVDPKFRGHQITRQLIEWWVNMSGECLTSDENQTPEGAGVWESMILRRPRLQFSLWYPNKREVPLLVNGNQIAPDPWADPDSRLVARPLPTSPVRPIDG